MTCFSWLHLTDLHCGSEAQDCLSPGEKEIFFNDLKKLHKKCGPWDLVLFTGDLTHQGSIAEFKRVDIFFNQLWEHFNTLGFTPKLLAVPGNHDIARFDKENPPPSVRLLGLWENQPDVQREFWGEANSPYREEVAEAFACYTAWWKKQNFKAEEVNDGILPGDFAVTVEKNGAKLGILGLNTAFLQLTDGEYQGKLALHASQLHGACNENGLEWAKQHHVCLLLTHHPPAWLNPEARNCLNGEIADHGRFTVHFCGHRHTPDKNAYQWIAISGTEEQRIWQSRSLFAIKSWREDLQQKKQHNSHGYAAGKIELWEDKGILKLWPRETRLQGGQVVFVPDHSVKLANGREYFQEEFNYPFSTEKTAGKDCVRCIQREGLLRNIKENLNDMLVMIENHSG